MATSESGSELTESDAVDQSDAGQSAASVSDSVGSQSGRSGQIRATRGESVRRWWSVGVLAAFLIVLAVMVALFDSDDAAVRAELRRRAVSELELQGVGLEPVRPDQHTGADTDEFEATLVTLSDEHLDNGVVATRLLEHLDALGPQVVSVAQTEISDRGIGEVLARREVWGLSLLGTGIDDGSLSVLEGRGRLRLLSLERTAVSDPGLVHLSQLTGLRHLYLTGTRVTGDGLDQLAHLTRLESLKLGGTDIGDLGLVPLARLPRLKHLTLDRTRITDAGVPVLAEIRSLEYLDLHATWVTVEGIRILRDALPGCRIEY